MTCEATSTKEVRGDGTTRPARWLFSGSRSSIRECLIYYSGKSLRDATIFTMQSLRTFFTPSGDGQPCPSAKQTPAFSGKSLSRLAGEAPALGGALGILILVGCATSPPPPQGVIKITSRIWNLQETRHITEFIEIPAGVTLLLAPGTTLRFAFVDRDGDGIGDAGLHVLGRIEAVGTPTAPIVFTSAETEPQPGDWQGLVLDNSADNLFTECRFEYAQHALHAHFSAARLERCRLERNIEGTRLGNSSFAIEHSLVRGNVSKGLNFFGCSNAIRHNSITGNADGVFFFETDTNSVVEANNIVGNQRYDVRLGDFYRGGKILGENWFGTTDLATIREKVFDRRNDPSLGRLEFTPALAPFDTGWESEQ